MTSDLSTVTFPEHAEGFRPLDPDTLVRITKRSASGDASIDDCAASSSVEYVVEGFAFGPDGDDPNGRAYYLLDIPDHSFGGNYWAYPEDVEAVSTPAQRAEARESARTTLTGDLMAQYIASSAMSGSNGVEFDEASWGNGGGILSGTTEDGVRFTAMFSVFSVEIDD